MSLVPVLDARQIRRIVLTESRRANVGHIGSCLSVVDILAVLYGGVLCATSPRDPDRDRFILSKGHAALALYATLRVKGWMSADTLGTFCRDGSCLGVHPEHAIDGVDFSTGSLGHGMSFGAGAALAARLQGSTRRVYCLVSDAECNEGSTWEAVMFAAQHRLRDLTAIVDVDGQQAFGQTAEIMDLSSLAARWDAFGWGVSEVDGHSPDALLAAFDSRSADGRPHVVLAHTIFGKGVSFMEQGIPGDRGLPVRPINWHYLPMTAIEFDRALEELERG